MNIFQNIAKELQEKNVPETCYSSIKNNILRENGAPQIITYVLENDKKIMEEYENFKNSKKCVWKVPNNNNNFC